MAKPTVNLSALTAYAGQREKALILQVLKGLTASKDLTLMTGIKSTRQLTKLTTASVAKPFAPEFEATDSSLTFSDREIRTWLGKGEWLINVFEFYESWLELELPDGVPANAKASVPWTQYVFKQLADQLSTDINLNTIWGGVRNPLGKTAKDIANGFGTILKAEIAAQKLIANVTGKLTNTTAVDQVEMLYKAHDAKYRDMEMFAYMSYASADAYREDYRRRFPNQASDGTFVNRPIAQSDGKCFIKPALWMGNSNRVIITPKENMIIGTDKESDMNEMRVLPRLWTLEVGAAFNIGCQVRDLEVMQVNDVD